MKYLTILLIIAVAVALVYADECQPGDTKAIDCNSCKCIQGSWACTKKACRPTKRDTHCNPGETFKKDCNTCVCSPDGKNAACTLKLC
nr:protease inhibitors-like [Onthophagus taurus]